MTHPRDVMAQSLATIEPRGRWEAFRGRHPFGLAWSLYLIVAIAMVPFHIPLSAAQIIPVDLINGPALLAFFCAVLIYHVPVRYHFALPTFIALVGSVLAITNATSPSTSVLALVKDAYLYFWFIALVVVLRNRGDLFGVRLAWACTGLVVALIVFGQAAATGNLSVHALFVSHRERAMGTFNNPNLFADYMMFSIFMLLGLVNQVPWFLIAPAFLVLMMTLLTSKSNGGLLSTLFGLGVWAFSWAWARGVSRQKLMGIVAVGLGIVIAAVWLHGELGVGDGLVRGVLKGSALGRMSNSAGQREQIWHRIEETYARSPLGIGPKNSAQQTLDIADRERPDSFRSKEAHDDYLAFAIERGPLGLVGLLFGIWMVVGMVLRGRPRLDRRLGSVAAGGALWAAFVGALAASSFHSLVIEKLHFRHFWLLLAVITAMCGETEQPAEVAAATGAPRRREPALLDATPVGAVPVMEGS